MEGSVKCGNVVTGDWKSQWATEGKLLRQFGSETKREGILKSPEQWSPPLFISSIPTWNSSPTTLTSLKSTMKIWDNLLLQRGNFGWTSNSCSVLGVLDGLDCSFSIPSSLPVFLPHLDPERWVRTSSTTKLEGPPCLQQQQILLCLDLLQHQNCVGIVRGAVTI